MDEASSARTPARIDAAELNWVESVDEGRRLCLRMRDTAGRSASVSLPVDCLNTLLTAIPGMATAMSGSAEDQPKVLDSWTLSRAGDRLCLTLHTPDGKRIAFAITPWQIEAIASLAACSVSSPPRRLN